MRFFALSLLLLACGPIGPPKEPHCITSLGMRYMGQWETGVQLDDWNFTCEYFQSAEDELIQNIGSTYRKDANLDTARLNGVEIWLMDTPDWVDNYGRAVAGESFCALGYMQINNAIFAKWSSFAHETIHFLQACNAVLPIDPKRDIDHANWDRDGLYSAIEETTTFK